MPGTARFASHSLGAIREPRAKFIAPAANGFVTHHDAALEEQLFNVAQAQLKPEIPANGTTDHHRREAMAVIERFRLFHLPILRDHLGNVTKPGWAMGSVGDYFDNAMCESFFATLECELLARCRFQTHDQARHAIFEYLESWYNLRRRHSGLGYRSPAIFEDTYRTKIKQSPEPVASCPPPASVMVVKGVPPADGGQLSSGI
jgi:hypothetical protein